MADGDYVVSGTATVSATGPASIATVDVTATGATANDTVLLTQTNLPSDTKGPFQFKVTDVTTNAFTITADRAQLPIDATFMFIVFEKT